MIFNVASSPGEPVKQRVFLFWRHGCSADLCLQRQKPAMLAQMPLFVYRHFTGASCTTSSDGRFALFSAPSTAAFSVASIRVKGGGACGGQRFNEEMFGADKQVFKVAAALVQKMTLDQGTP